MGIIIKDILSVLPNHETLNCDIYIEAGEIVSLDEKPEGFVADNTINGKGKLIIPGLINTHTHTYMTVFRNIADDLDFNTWLFKRIMPLEEKMLYDEAYWSSQLACMEMIKDGITCFLDMHMFIGSSIMAASNSKMRAVISRGLSGSADDYTSGNKRLSEAISEIRNYNDLPRIYFMLAPHAAYTCNEDYLNKIADIATEMRLGINTHISESQREVQQIYDIYQCSPIELYDRCGLLKNNTVAAHCVHLSDDDIDILYNRGVSVSINSSSNLKLGNGIAPVCKLLERGVNICLGTDSAASNNNLSILHELRLVTLLHKGLNYNPTAVSASEGLNMATRNAAKALGMENDIGEIRVGYKADLTIYNILEASMMPIGEPISALCYSSSGLKADTVIVDGNILFSNGEFTSIDTERVNFEVNKMCKRLGL